MRWVCSLWTARWMLCATRKAWAEHLKNVLPNSRWQDISQISRLIYQRLRGWYNQHVWSQKRAWLPTDAFPSVTEYTREGNTTGTIDWVFCSSARVVARSKPWKCLQWHPCRCSSSINWRAKESACGRGHRQVSQWCFSFFSYFWSRQHCFLTRLFVDGSGSKTKVKMHICRCEIDIFLPGGSVMHLPAPRQQCANSLALGLPPMNSGCWAGCQNKIWASTEE